MYPKILLRSSSFRLALAYGTLFAASALAILAFVYLATTRYMQQQADETIEAEIQGLAERYRLTGLSGLTSLIRQRLDRSPAGSSIYLLADAEFNPLVGNLSRWPTAADTVSDEGGFLNFDLRSPGHRARAKPFLLAEGFRLLVGRDMYELQSVRSLLLRTMAWSVALTLALAFVGGLVVSRSRLSRIAEINKAIAEVMSGNLNRRIAIEPTGDDIEDLAVRLNQMLDELEKLVEGVRRVSDAVAHDLRTPLARLKTRLERLLKTKGDPEIEVAIQETDHLLAVFAALLRIARIETGERARAVLANVDLTSLVDDVAELYAPLIEDADKKLVLHNAPGVEVRGDRDMLFQALVNLLDNALKHTSRGGQIEVALSSTGEGIEIVVADDGPGIPIEERSRVRERFYRLDRSRTTAGAGLGLSLVEAVAKLHAGSLQLLDNAPGLRAVVRLGTREGDGKNSLQSSP
ncbi:MAG TPA: HAMP domain-containing sensor histidine kinase [Vicinamibacteria bacterium]|nr:HAMP domain-containing sensor histidine kinase [Vicinamibacteria bacterium]